MAITGLNKDNFNKEIQMSKICVVEFYSDNCNVCKVLTPVLEELSQEKNEICFFNIQSQDNMQLCMSYRVMSVPTTVIFKNGEMIDKFTGLKTKDEVNQILSKLL